MIFYKTGKEIERIKKSSLLVGKTLAEIAKIIKPGVTTLDLDKVAEEFIRDNNAIPGFLGYGGFPNSLCTSVNSAVVHGIPNKKPLIEGDIVSVDCGVLMDDFFGDSAYTFEIGEVSKELYFLTRLGKAGQSRWLNRRPTVRGVAMNPIDHPHGGGEGKKSGTSRTPWGKPNKRGKTSKSVNKLIIKKK